MPRPLRIEYKGANHHVMTQGNQREAILQNDENPKRFLEPFGEACTKALDRHGPGGFPVIVP